MYDLVIKGGTIIDGTGKGRFESDIAVADGFIKKIGVVDDSEGKEVINAKGLMVTPGFIDSHNHSDFFILLGTNGQNELEQGFTTEMLGQCGESAAPFYAGTYDAVRNMVPPEAFKKLEKKQKTPSLYMKNLEEKTFGTNFGLLVGHLSVRGHVMGSKSDRPTEDEMKQMRALVREAMECGYFGFSVGLVYPPSVYASEEELVDLAKVAASHGGIYSSHIRGEDDRVVQAVEEALRIGGKAGADVVISHHKVAGKQNEGLSRKTLKLIDEANESGMKVRMDQYPYLAGACGLIDAVPPVFRENGSEYLFEGLKKPEFRTEVRNVIENDIGEFENFIYKSGFEGCLILTCPIDNYVGKSIEEIAREKKEDPYDTFFDILLETGGNALCAYFMVVESDMKRIFCHPYTMAGTDFMHVLKEPDPKQKGGWHPRSTSTAIKRLCMVRDEKLMSIEQEINRLTGMPADFYNIKDRGVLETGKAADIVVFNLDELRTEADYIYPLKKNAGIKYVLVNGEVVVSDGAYNGKRAGKVLKHKCEK